ncbi:hypothetical protein MTO96_012659 [Rhipicephalus appendiculatus]
MMLKLNCTDIPEKLREDIMASMRPEHNTRRLARARTVLRQVSNEERGVAFVDAAFHANRKGFVAVVVDGAGRVVNSATVRMKEPTIVGTSFHRFSTNDG